MSVQTAAEVDAHVASLRTVRALHTQRQCDYPAVSICRWLLVAYQGHVPMALHSSAFQDLAVSAPAQQPATSLDSVKNRRHSHSMHREWVANSCV